LEPVVLAGDVEEHLFQSLPAIALDEPTGVPRSTIRPPRIISTIEHNRSTSPML
jgi:hypothetical protein